MKIAFLSFDAYEGRSTGYYPPVHLCLLATSLSRAGYDAKIFDYSASFMQMGELFKSIADFKPDILGVTCYTPKMKPLYQVTKQLRDILPNAAMIVGGAHPTAWPNWTLDHFPQFDYAMVGEADRAIVEFAEMIDGKRDESNVKGLVYKTKGEIVCNESDKIMDLSTLFIPDRNFLDQYYKEGLYWDMAAKSPLDVMITSRGCTYDCSFCFKVERRARFHSVDYVMTEFETMRRKNIKSIHIQDDAFTVNAPRCKIIAEALIAGRYKFDIKVRGRVNSAKEELLKLLRKAGVNTIIYGLESGSQKMLDSMNKRTTVEQNREAIRITKKVGINCLGEIMIGMPGENRETINETIQFLLETKPIIGYVPVLYPLPNTKVYNDAQKDGSLAGDWTADGEWPWVRLPWAINKSDIESEAARINHTIQRDPGTIFYFIKSLWPKLLGLKQMKFLIKIALSHIRR
jgi:anaerobic magnesium-protoporphyrin IX monomethyl ester cyclase